MTPPPPPQTICPMFGDQCRFFSQEHIFVPYSALVENPNTKRLCVGSTGIKKEPVGNYCNNIGSWIAKLPFCPARVALDAFSFGVVADGTGVYPGSQCCCSQREPVKVASVLFRED